MVGFTDQDLNPSRFPPLRLRKTTKDDLPELFEMQLDPLSNAMAVTNPRSPEAFAAHWDNVFQDSSTVPLVILLSDQIVGLVACFRSEHCHSIGYSIHRDFWGQGIATQALQQLLRDVPDRPLHAQAAISNKASLRVLEKCGFEIEEVCVEPASERYPECEVAKLVLR